MRPVTEDVRDILLGAGLRLTFAEDLFIAEEPPDPDRCVTLLEAPGRSPLLTLRNDGRMEYPSFQVRVRHRSYTQAWQLSHAVKETLHGVHQQSIGGARYELVRCIIEPWLTEIDAPGRAVLVSTYEATRKEE